MPTSRLFVALVPPAPVRREIADLATPLSGVRWTSEENIHLTMRFIGETTPEKRDRFAASLARVKVAPFILPVQAVGVFPTRGPAKVLWVGVGNAHTRLFQLRKQIDDALLSVDGGLDVRHFHPHFTVGRLGENCEEKDLEKFIDRHAAFEAPPFRVNEIHLMTSESGSPRSSTRAYLVVQTLTLQPRQ